MFSFFFCSSLLTHFSHSYLAAYDSIKRNIKANGISEDLAIANLGDATQVPLFLSLSLSLSHIALFCFVLFCFVLCLVLFCFFTFLFRCYTTTETKITNLISLIWIHMVLLLFFLMVLFRSQPKHTPIDRIIYPFSLLFLTSFLTLFFNSCLSPSLMGAS